MSDPKSQSASPAHTKLDCVLRVQKAEVFTAADTDLSQIQCFVIPPLSFSPTLLSNPIVCIRKATEQKKSHKAKPYTI